MWAGRGELLQKGRREVLEKSAWWPLWEGLPCTSLCSPLTVDGQQQGLWGDRREQGEAVDVS